ncbi:LysR family transcriptional regulator [Paracidovorax citrulli]|uniref:Transcriptional regulator, LysR family n=2 Tax=Paracidovorax citrulli TaxID=80869 RepID=A1TJG4_PARC0|nr:LysR family transcriptional regulator [Paracidovorax citrulli]ABM31102.1 transcriptional regulator, LysR family [Paracidovorax citrulli AAC00-1]ATG95748.1 LysR family transcriptional regulator [Paracidovorax citrulli]PVY65285.1 DNA-binding transcriptional LysR family regulator [Paracidovorax citrulli]REG70527.1 DNA-binding transcriptional LysR family regulator [Paracidovorax citrulli]RLJ95079.1 DNA-binding transcriptional LysR family regulator [Paracidovorax citrulli]
MQFRLKQMDVFRAVMLTGTVKGAAAMLCQSQPAVSRSLAHTEQSLGLTLFQRTKGRLVPTPEAEALIEQVNPFFQHAIRINDFATSLRTASVGHLTVISSYCLSRGLVSRAVVRFMERHPKVQVQLRTSLLADMPKALLSEEADIAVAAVAMDHLQLQVQPLTEGRMVCVMQTGHPLAGADSVCFTDLAKHVVITPHPSIPFGQLLSAALERAGVSLDARVNVHNMDLACALVRAGAGLAIVDEFTVDGLDGMQGLATVALKEDVLIAPAVICSAHRAMRPCTESFLDALTEQAFMDRQRRSRVEREQKPCLSAT